MSLPVHVWRGAACVCGDVCSFYVTFHYLLLHLSVFIQPFLCFMCIFYFCVSFSSYHLMCVCVCVTITANLELNRQTELQSENTPGTHTPFTCLSVQHFSLF